MTRLLVRHCAPTLMGIKAGSLISCPIKGLNPWRRAISAQLHLHGLQLAVLRVRGDMALIYLFRREMLLRDLKQRTARNLLRPLGYDPMDVNALLNRLRERLLQTEVFPHEIGLFLGYPAQDVKGFIENGGRAYKSCGLWKVYGDQEQAANTFRMYRQCTRCLMRRYCRGEDLVQLLSRQEEENYDHCGNLLERHGKHTIHGEHAQGRNRCSRRQREAIHTG